MRGQLRDQISSLHLKTKTSPCLSSQRRRPHLVAVNSLFPHAAEAAAAPNKMLRASERLLNLFPHRDARD